MYLCNNLEKKLFLNINNMNGQSWTLFQKIAKRDFFYY